MEKIFHLRTTNHDEMIEITYDLENWIQEEGVINGILSVFPPYNSRDYSERKCRPRCKKRYAQAACRNISMASSGRQAYGR